MAEIRPINLRPCQNEHKNRLIEILQRSPFAFDFSMLGTGKTYTSSKIYRELGFSNLVTIVPTSVKAKWRYMEEHHGIEQFASISYCELRSIRLKQPKHKFLVRKDFTSKRHLSDGTTQDVDQCSFTCTNYYLNLVENGLLLVIDEVQNVKNVSDQLLACRELIRPIVESFEKGGNSRVLLLSGSPIDKEVQVIHLYRCLGIMRSEKLRAYNPFTGEMVDQGIEEIRDYLYRKFPARFQKAVKGLYYEVDYWGTKPKDLERRCYRWFQHVVKPELASSMPPKVIRHNDHQPVTITKQNAFYLMGPSDLHLLHKGIDRLQKASNFNPLYGTVNHGHNGVEALTNIQQALVMIETSKINLMVRIAKSKLSCHPRTKVAICVNYTATIDDLLDLLGEYRPLKLNGSCSSSQRYEILEKFQRPDTDHRLLIGNVTVCSTGIDLDDQDGNYPRFCLVNPNYSAISLYQLSHRFHRAETKSNSTIHFLFGLSDTTELPILNALAKKGQVMKETTEKQAEFGIVFPGEYPRWEEIC
jgi:superfamily II DNA or RNA helicase